MVTQEQIQETEKIRKKEESHYDKMLPFLRKKHEYHKLITDTLESEVRYQYLIQKLSEIQPENGDTKE